MNPTVTITSRRNDTTRAADREFRVSLPAPQLGITFDTDRRETAPNAPTIRHDAKPQRIHGAAAQSVVDRKLFDIAAAIIAARSAMMPAVTVQIDRNA